MLAVGIVAEYNPFHNGHEHHLRETLRLTGATHSVIIMSGAFTQRARPALISKNARAKSAVYGGADLVLELPAVYSTASAEIFADKAVTMLFAAGVLDFISFGSECGDIENLWEIAKIIDLPQTKLLISENLEKGLSYPAARQKAAEYLLKEKAKALSSPNNLLGVEYLRAIIRHNLPLSAVTVARRGAGHHSGSVDFGFASAGHIRRLSSRDISSVTDLLPRYSEEILKTEFLSGRALTDTALLDRTILAKLRLTDEKAFSNLFDSTEGLENRFYRGTRHASTLDELYEFVKSKRYTLSRIRRMALHAFLNITKEDLHIKPPYLRVLAFNEKGRTLLSLMRKKSTLPILTKTAHLNGLCSDARRIFETEAAACDIRELFCQNALPFGSDYKQNPLYIKSSGDAF